MKSFNFAQKIRINNVIKMVVVRCFIKKDIMDDCGIRILCEIRRLIRRRIFLRFIRFNDDTSTCISHI